MSILSGKLNVVQEHQTETKLRIDPLPRSYQVVHCSTSEDLSELDNSVYGRDVDIEYLLIKKEHQSSRWFKAECLDVTHSDPRNSSSLSAKNSENEQLLPSSSFSN